MIGSPLNYTGNKFKLLKQLIPYLDNQSDTFIDIFAGSGLVALNTNSANLFLNDNNPITIELLNYFKDNDAKIINKNMDKIITKYNKIPYNILKEDYNSNPSVDKLFALIVFGFNHYIRYNSKGLFNVPVGKVDYTASLREKTEQYTNALKEKNITITTKDFRDLSLYSNKNALYYFDPPYLITMAPYNATWSEKDEKDLLDLLDNLDKRGYKFALSNVIESNGKTNKLLKEWAKKYNTIYLNRKYLNSNYRKKNITVAQEVLITNYIKEEEV